MNDKVNKSLNFFSKFSSFSFIFNQYINTFNIVTNYFLPGDFCCQDFQNDVKFRINVLQRRLNAYRSFILGFTVYQLKI